MGVVETVCDRVVVVSDGRVVADDSVDALLRNDDSHTLRLASSDFGGELLSDLRERVGVTDVEPRDRGARIRVRTDSDGLYELMSYLRSRDVGIDRIETVETDLESVFVDLTGGGKR
jgi:ABC-2 type transport system ATP-binding protein